MRTRFVIHKNLLSPVYRVIKRPKIQQGGILSKWYPEDLVVENTKRKDEGGYFILPKYDYLPCDKNGVVKNVETAYLAECGAQPESRVEADKQNSLVA